MTDKQPYLQRADVSPLFTDDAMIEPRPPELPPSFVDTLPTESPPAATDNEDGANSQVRAPVRLVARRRANLYRTHALYVLLVPRKSAPERGELQDDVVEVRHRVFRYVPANNTASTPFLLSALETTLRVLGDERLSNNALLGTTTIQKTQPAYTIKELPNAFQNAVYVGVYESLQNAPRAQQSLRNYLSVGAGSSSAAWGDSALKQALFSLLWQQWKMQSVLSDEQLSRTLLQYTLDALEVRTLAEPHVYRLQANEEDDPENRWLLAVGPSPFKYARFHPNRRDDLAFQSNVRIGFFSSRSVWPELALVRNDHIIEALRLWRLGRQSRQQALDLPANTLQDELLRADDDGDEQRAMSNDAYLARVYPYHLPFETLCAFFDNSAPFTFRRTQASDLWAIGHCALQLASVEYTHPHYVNIPLFKVRDTTTNPYAVDSLSPYAFLSLGTYYEQLDALYVDLLPLYSSRGEPESAELFYELYGYLAGIEVTIEQVRSVQQSTMRNQAAVHFVALCNHLVCVLMLSNALASGLSASAIEQTRVGAVLLRHLELVRDFSLRTLFRTDQQVRRYNESLQAAVGEARDKQEAATAGDGGSDGSVDQKLPRAPVPSLGMGRIDVLLRTPSVYTPYVDSIRFRFGDEDSALLLLQSLMAFDASKRGKIDENSERNAVLELLRHPYFSILRVDYDTFVREYAQVWSVVSPPLARVRVHREQIPSPSPELATTTLIDNETQLAARVDALEQRRRGTALLETSTKDGQKLSTIDTLAIFSQL